MAKLEIANLHSNLVLEISEKFRASSVSFVTMTKGPTVTSSPGIYLQKKNVFSLFLLSLIENVKVISKTQLDIKYMDYVPMVYADEMH